MLNMPPKSFLPRSNFMGMIEFSISKGTFPLKFLPYKINIEVVFP
jgi:hypothetical protein